VAEAETAGAEAPGPPPTRQPEPAVAKPPSRRTVEPAPPPVQRPKETPPPERRAAERSIPQRTPPRERVRTFLRHHPDVVRQQVQTGLSLRFVVDPDDAFVLVDGQVIGRASEFSGKKSYRLAGAGDHLILLRKTGMMDYVIRVQARSGVAGSSVISAHLEAVPAAAQALGQLQHYRVREAVAFEVEPPYARILVDGRIMGPANRYSGGGGAGSWLRMEPGVHRVSVQAPGYKQVDLVVEVGRGTKKDRQKIKVRLASQR
jgi:hypothetical protein